jgi:hypothetical protein
VIIKVAYVGEGMFQVGDSDIPYDETSLLQLVQSYADLDDVKALTWIDEIKQTKQGQLQEKEANRGVIVDLYEVEYPTPTNPLKETEDLASHLDEKKDFVTQYLFPGNETKDITVGLSKDLLKGQPQQPVPKQATKQGWRQVLSWEVKPEFPISTTPITQEQLFLWFPVWKNWLQGLSVLRFPWQLKKLTAETDHEEREIDFIISTRKYEYRVMAVPRQPNTRDGYLSCVVNEKRTGKGNDLEDGRYGVITWSKIVNDINEYETQTGRWNPNGEDEGVFVD